MFFIFHVLTVDTSPVQDQQIQELLNLQEISQRLASEPGSLHFITREAAQQERADVEDELESVRKRVVERDQGKQTEIAKHARLADEFKEHSKKLEAECLCCLYNCYPY